MRFHTRFFSIILAVLTVSATAFLIASEIRPAEPAGLTVHEWGTFTSIAGDDGMAVDWHALDGPADLPCFVHRFEYGAKADLNGTVRMETPVIYFYGPEASTARVRVTFPKGFITEWYPKANRVATYIGSGMAPRGPDVRQPRGNEPDSIEWPAVRLAPALETPALPFESAASRYYAARSTDAAPLLAGDENEKFLFYRGVGKFQPPILVQANSADQIVVNSLGGERIPAAILFENHDGKIAYRIEGPVDREMTFEQPLAATHTNTLGAEMERILVSQGLFPREAMAMVATWGDSWFEEGTRVFYFLPESAIDRVLPLEIQPAPTRIARVFVGRAEVFTPSAKRAIMDAIAHGDRRPLEMYGRFLEPITSKMGEGPWVAQMDSMRGAYLKREAACRH
jgi:hypothetical protein